MVTKADSGKKGPLEDNVAVCELFLQAVCNNGYAKLWRQLEICLRRNLMKAHAARRDCGGYQ